MPAYNTRKRPEMFPLKYHQAFERVIGGKLGMTYETYIGDDQSNHGKRWHGQHISAFKKVIAGCPHHPLHKIIPLTRTRLRVERMPDGSDKLWLGVTLYEPVSLMLEGVVD